jgi:hypothetical protein
VRFFEWIGQWPFDQLIKSHDVLLNQLRLLTNCLGRLVRPYPLDTGGDFLTRGDVNPALSVGRDSRQRGGIVDLHS